MSSNLTFSASYQTGNTGNSNNQSASICFPLFEMQYECIAYIAVDVIPSVDMIESVNATVSGPYGSASSLNTDDLG